MTQLCKNSCWLQGGLSQGAGLPQQEPLIFLVSLPAAGVYLLFNVPRLFCFTSRVKQILIQKIRQTVFDTYRKMVISPHFFHLKNKTELEILYRKQRSMFLLWPCWSHNCQTIWSIYRRLCNAIFAACQLLLQKNCSIAC